MRVPSIVASLSAGNPITVWERDAISGCYNSWKPAGSITSRRLRE